MFVDSTCRYHESNVKISQDESNVKISQDESNVKISQEIYLFIYLF